VPKHYPGPWVLRTLLFTPGHNEKLIVKALASAADCVVLDLEDAVPEHAKQTARQVIRKVLAEVKPADRTVMVRINPLESGLTLLDLDEVACRGLDGIVFPKAYCADDIKAFDAQLTLKEKTLGLEPGHFTIVILVETPQAVLNAFEMATSSDRVIGLLFGCEDFLTDMEGFHGPGGRSLTVPRHLTAMAARAAGVVPIDTPYVRVKDEAGFEEHLRQGREMGYEGILVMTPRQIETARRFFTPSAEELEQARKTVQLAGEAVRESRGIAVAGDVFISPPTLKRARKVLQRNRAIDGFEAFRRAEEKTAPLPIISSVLDPTEEISKPEEVLL
jgi:citrate lyase subunit beta/citryl-CoA lyase